MLRQAQQAMRALEAMLRQAQQAMRALEAMRAAAIAAQPTAAGVAF